MSTKKFLASLMILPLLTFCGNKTNPDPEPGPGPEPQPQPTAVVNITSPTDFSFGCEGGSGTITFTSNVDWTIAADDAWVTLNPTSGKASDNAVNVTFTCEPNPKLKKRSTYIVLSGYGVQKNISVEEAGNPMSGAAAPFKSGDVLQANSLLTQEFLDEVNYPDWPDEDAQNRTTKIFDYYGGFDGETLTWDNWETEWPDGDKPMAYSIQWAENVMDGSAMNLHMEDALGWSGDLEIAAGSRYVNITNLVPNDSYTYKVTTASGATIAEGTFTTVGNLHHVFFSGDVQVKKGVEIKGEGGRNARDLGGWTGLDGKKIKYRKVYRGGRLNEKWKPYPLNLQGEKEVLFEGIGAELDLRGNDDVMFTSAVTIEGKELDHCAPVIEQGGKTMLVNDAAKTKECFEFVLASVRNNKPVYFHCSLGRDRTGTLSILLMGLLGVREGDIAKEYELTYFAPVGYSVSSSDKKSNPKPTFHNTRLAWVYSDVVPYFWEKAQQTTGKTFAEGVEKYLLDVAGVPQEDINEFRNLMLE